MEDMDKWVRAKAVKGLFPTAEQPPQSPAATPSEPAFDFFEAASPEAPESAPVEEFIPAFDFFGGNPEPPPPPEPPPAEPVPMATPAEEGATNFRLTVPMASAAEPPAPKPHVPMAAPASAVDLLLPPLTPDLTGPELALEANGSARQTGVYLELFVTSGWLLARGATVDGVTSETYLRLSRLDSAFLSVQRGADIVLAFRSGTQTVAVQCDGGAASARALLSRVVDAAGER
jgi:hypothetical protein